MKYQVEQISRMIRIEKRVKKIITIIVLIILLLLFFVNSVMLYQRIHGNNELPNFAGVSVLNIISGSMTPTLNINDMIVIKKVSNQDIKQGDIITFNKNGVIDTHRVIWVVDDEGQRKYKTKGDNNEIPDDELVTYSEIYGKLILKIPKIGKIAEELQKNNGLICCVIIICIFIILKNKKEKRKETRKLERKKYEIKKLRDG